MSITPARLAGPIRMGSFSMVREDTVAGPFPYPLQRGTFSRSSTSSTVSTRSSLSHASDISTTSTLVGTLESKLSSYVLKKDAIEIEEEEEAIVVPACYDDTVCEQCHDQLSPISTSRIDLSDGESTEQGSDLSLKPLLANLKTHFANQLSSLDRSPRIVGLLATPDEGCRMYAGATSKACASNGLDFETLQMVPSDSEGDEEGARVKFEDVQKEIERLNDDMSVDGLIVYFPIFGPEKDEQLRSLISSRIDIEGVHPHNLLISSLSPPSSLEDEQHTVYPCTPLAVVRILQSLKGMYDLNKQKGERLVGKVITVVNRSETVGRPLAIMLANEGTIVFSVDISSIQIYQRHNPSSTYCIRSSSTPHTPEQCFAISDIIISAVPSSAYKVPTNQIKRGAICLNIATGNNFQEDVRGRAGVFVRRLGSVTTLMLMLNAVVLCCRRGY